MRSSSCLLSMALICTIALPGLAGAEFDWRDLHAMEKTDDGYRTTGVHPWMFSAPLDEPIPADRHCLLIEMKASQPIPLTIYWVNEGEELAELRAVRLHMNAVDDYGLFAANLDENGAFTGASRLRIGPGGGAGVTLDIKRIRFVTPQEVPDSHLPSLIGFRCYTSKLHYQPGEMIPYQAILSAQCYPDRESSKLLRILVRDSVGSPVAYAFQQYGLRTSSRFKELRGIIELSQPLDPGKYTLEAKSIDQRSGLELTYEHAFGIQNSDDPFVYETPFKFVKDFSIVRGPDDRYHIFSITGDLWGDHGWSGDGMERTFSHGSSDDLRHWTIHPPVLSITDNTYPDGKGKYEDRNIWAPHVVEHNGKYWMFYTSINQHVSQSVSLATSTDLFNWTEHEANPVFTLEGVEWANWERDRWADARDPCVLIDGDKFYIYVTASVHGPGETGAIVVAESDDLVTWRNPKIAVRGHIVSESPQVWRDGDTYCMTTSSIGANTYTSSDPMTGWKVTDFPRPDIKSFEDYVQTSGSYAEEVIRMPSGEWLMASLTFRHFGNSIYLFKMKTEDGLPVEYESPFELGK